MQGSMDVIHDILGLDKSSSAPLSYPTEMDPGDQVLQATDEREQMHHWDVSNDSATSHDTTSASPSSSEVETDRNEGRCDEMIEKWRLIRLADKNRARKKVTDVSAFIWTRS